MKWGIEDIKPHMPSEILKQVSISISLFERIIEIPDQIYDLVLAVTEQTQTWTRDLEIIAFC